MSITLQAIVLAAAVVALSVVAVDSLDIWEWEKFAQNDGTVSEYTADKSVYASDADAEKSATISVTGTATASVDPDIFTVRLGVSTQDKNAGMALSSNSKTMENVIAGVMGAGINRDEISTSSLKVYPVYGDYDYDKNESPIVGFRAENIILIETTKLDSATSIIDGASEAGANRQGSKPWSTYEAWSVHIRGKHQKRTSRAYKKSPKGSMCKTSVHSDCKSNSIKITH